MNSTPYENAPPLPDEPAPARQAPRLPTFERFVQHPASERASPLAPGALSFSAASSFPLLSERLCEVLAFLVAELEQELGDSASEEIAAACSAARGLIEDAGFDFDALARRAGEISE